MCSIYLWHTLYCSSHFDMQMISYLWDKYFYVIAEVFYADCDQEGCVKCMRQTRRLLLCVFYCSTVSCQRLKPVTVLMKLPNTVLSCPFMSMLRRRSSAFSTFFWLCLCWSTVLIVTCCINFLVVTLYFNFSHLLFRSGEQQATFRFMTMNVIQSQIYLIMTIINNYQVFK